MLIALITAMILGGSGAAYDLFGKDAQKMVLSVLEDGEQKKQVKSLMKQGAKSGKKASKELASLMKAWQKADLDPANSYRLTLNEKGKLEWTAEGPDGPEVWHKEPGTSAWQRFKARVMSWIPMESEL